MKLSVTARGRQRRAPDVIGDVEVAVVDPDRPGQAERDLADLLPVARDLRQPGLDGRQQRLVAQAGRGLRRMDSVPTYMGVDESSSP